MLYQIILNVVSIQIDVWISIEDIIKTLKETSVPRLGSTKQNDVDVQISYALREPLILQHLIHQYDDRTRS